MVSALNTNMTCYISAPSPLLHLLYLNIANLSLVPVSCAGEYDPLPEQAFYMVGPIEEVVQKAEKLAEEHS